jgi:hypothetical protein
MCSRHDEYTMKQIFGDSMSARDQGLRKGASSPGQIAARITLVSRAALVLMTLFAAGPVSAQAQIADGLDERWIAETASDLNRLLPRQVDMETRLDAVTAGPGRRLSFHYTLLDRTRAGMDVEAFNAGLQPVLRGAVCRKDSTWPSSMTGVTLSYHYRGSDGKFVSMIEIPHLSCK